MEIFFIIVGIAMVIVIISIRQINQYEKGILFTFGKFSKVLEPGWNFVFPIFQFYKKIDVRTKVIDVPEQDTITKDNVSVRVNAVIFYSIFDSKLAICAIEDYFYAVSQLALTTMRNLVGTVTLDELLNERDKINQNICKIVDKESDPWGIRVESVELKEIKLPEEMKRVIAKAAEAEREKKAVITKAEGEIVVSDSLAKAAELMSKTPGAMHLRTLSALNNISSDKSNTVVFAIPIEVLKALEGLGKK